MREVLEYYTDWHNKKDYNYDYKHYYDKDYDYYNKDDKQSGGWDNYKRRKLIDHSGIFLYLLSISGIHN